VKWHETSKALAETNGRPTQHRRPYLTPHFSSDHPTKPSPQLAPYHHTERIIIAAESWIATRGA
jgi:hypothetical protein